MKFRILVLVLGLVLYTTTIIAQTLPVGLLDNTDDYLRREQLLGKDSANSSFMIRPIHRPSGLDLNKTLWNNPKESIVLYALPVVWQQQYNTDHPYGMNDGAMIPARGYQTLLSAGVAAKIGPLSIQFRPEVIYAENKKFQGVLEAKNSLNIKNSYKNVLNLIDLTERYGDKSYSKLNWGQSSIRLNAGPVSFGLSNENLWWGPGTRSSLLMTNNAAGFKHLTLNTLAPVRTAIGSFEAQIIAGKLESAGVIPDFIEYRPKPDDWRYLSGIVFTYQPKWISGLYLGFDRSYIIYREQMGNSFSDYFPIFSGITKNNFGVEGDGPDKEDQKSRDQRISLFARWVMPEANAEIYFQYGREDHSKDLRDVVVEPDHSKAYVAGFRKLFPFKGTEKHIQVGFEVTKLESSGTSAVRNPSFWYTNTQVRDGYTQKGQVLGAGVGSGSNLLTLDVNWIDGWSRLGLQFERYSHNNTLYDRELTLERGEYNPWVDFCLTAKFDQEFKRFIFNSQLTYINSSNYQWVPQGSQNNFQIRVGVLYRW